MKWVTLFFSIILFFSANFALAHQQGFVDRKIEKLLEKENFSEYIIVEPQYNSLEQLTKIESRSADITLLVLEDIDTRLSNFRIKVCYKDNTIDIISGKYTTYLIAHVTSRYIKFGELISESDIVRKKIKLDKLSNDVVKLDSDIIGMKATKYIAAGTVLKQSDIKRPNILKNSDPVDIIYSSGAISLKTIGVALSAGAIGDVIRVRNSSSGTILLAHIMNKNTVCVGNK